MRMDRTDMNQIKKKHIVKRSFARSAIGFFGCRLVDRLHMMCLMGLSNR